jgi:glycosyltransferase involved in cell wall biosynthesis
MKVLMLSPFPYEAAATRVRCAQYIPYLQAQGVQTVLRSFMSPHLFAIVYRRGYAAAKLWHTIRAGLRRIGDWVRAERFDLIFVYRELLPFGPPLAEQLLVWSGKPLVFDFDDAIFLAPSSPANRRLQFLKLRGKVRRLVCMSRGVTAGNAFLATYARQFNDAVEVFPSTVDTECFCPGVRNDANTPITLGWVGSPTTAPYLNLLSEALRILAQRFDFRLKIVGAPHRWTAPGVRVEQYPWSLGREVSDFQSLDIGLYPLPRSLWALGKCGYKALQYWAVGIPVVCSPVGVLGEMVRPGENGFVAATTEEWVSAISRLIEDAALRRRLGQAGRAMVEEQYSVHAFAPRLQAFFSSVVS